MRRWLKITLVIVVVLLALLIGGGILIAKKVSAPTIVTTTASRQTIHSDVEFTGRVTAHDSADLGFELSGIAKNVNVHVGDTVRAGQVLASINPDENELAVAQAYATRVATMKDRQIAFQTAQTNAANTTAENSKSLVAKQQTVRDAKTAYDQALTTWEQMVRESGDESSLTQTKYSSVLAAKAAYVAAQQALSIAQKTVKASNDSAAAATTAAQADLLATEQAAENAPGISALQATESIARVRLGKTALIAPFAGTVTNKTIDAGQFVPAGSAVLTVQSLNTLEVTADVQETDIVKMQPGMHATMTLDAYGSDQSFDAVVTTIDPAGVLTQGVPTYKVTLHFNQPPQGLRTSFTANITVHVAEKQNALAIPRRSVTHTSDNKTTIEVVGADGKTQTKEIQTGLVGSDGNIEVTGGLSEGDTIILRTNQ